MSPVKWNYPTACEALRNNWGNIAMAARSMGIDRSTLSHAVKKSKKLQKAREIGRNRIVECAEDSLKTQIEQGNTAATIFALKCQGKGRKWIEKPPESAGKEDKLLQAVADLAAFTKGKL